MFGFLRERERERQRDRETERKGVPVSGGGRREGREGKVDKGKVRGEGL